MVSPNTDASARRLGQFRLGERVSPRTNRHAPSYYNPSQPPAAARLAVTSGGTTAVARGSGSRTPAYPPPARTLSFASSPAEDRASPYVGTHSLSSLSGSSSMMMSASSKRAPPPSSQEKNKNKKLKALKVSAPSDDLKHQEDKETDYIPLTNVASSSVLVDDKPDDLSSRERHRRAFYLRAFPEKTGDESLRKPQSTSAAITHCRPKKDYEYIIYVIQNWNIGVKVNDMEEGEEKEDLKRFRRINRRGCKYIHQYVVEEIEVPGEYEPRYVLRRMEKSAENPSVLSVGRVVISRDELFDAIDEWHHKNGHLGQERTWEYCRTKYWNVTQDHVRHYCVTCFTCMKKNPVTKKLKGAVKPIFSKNFRDRFQVDLIDFRRLRKRDPFGVLMRWVMSLKDHASGLTYLCALPRKQANLVAYKLQEIFGVIGYPKIFHTDNGKEFTAKCVLQFLRKKNPNILSVTGRSRTPRDQGSVENVNKFVKRILAMVLAERREEGENPNWTEVLGSVAATINSQCGRGKHDTTAFEAVYDQVIDFPMTCSKSEARRCWTVSQRMKVTSDKEFEEYCREHYVLDNDIESDDSEEQDSGYFSEEELPSDEQDEVNDVYFDAHLMDDTAIVTPSNSTRKMNKRPVGKSGDHVADLKRPPEELFADEKADLKRPPEELIADEKKNKFGQAEKANVGSNDPKVGDLKCPPQKEKKAKDESDDESYLHVLEGDEKPKQDKDDNGIIFAPSCSQFCFLKKENCNHTKDVKISLNRVGDYVKFSSLLWHKGFCKITSTDTTFFTAQFFCKPHCSEARATRSASDSAQLSYKEGHLVPSVYKLDSLTEDLLAEWDGDYSAKKYPPAKKFFGNIDATKNRHIKLEQIPSRPKVHNLVLALEELFMDITVDSVWLIKKQGEEDGFQEWHQDLKHKCSATIVLNIGVVTPARDDKHAASGLKFHSVLKCHYVNIKEAWEYHAHLAPKKNSVNYIDMRLDCDCSHGYGIVVANDKYIRKFRDTTAWWEYAFIQSFVALVNHSFHNITPEHYRQEIVVKFVTSDTPNAVVTSMDVTPCEDNVTHLVTVSYKSGHFAVLLFDVRNHEVTVYDGLNGSIKKWNKHVTFVLQKYGLATCGDEPQEVYTQDAYSELLEIGFGYEDNEVDNRPWAMVKDPVLKQHDGYNCGPIACLKVMEIYGMIPQDSIEQIRHSNDGYRGVVMAFYQLCLREYNNDIHFPINNKGNVQKYIKFKEQQKAKEVDDEQKAKEVDDESSKNRGQAMAMKNKRQAAQALKMMKQCGNAAMKSGVGPGAVVTLQVDYRTHYNPQGLVAIVYDFKKETGSIKVCCSEGVITHDGKKGDYWVPADKYVLNAAADAELPLPDDLARIRQLVILGRYEEHDAPRISYGKLHQKQSGSTSPTKRSKGCTCKKGGCGKKCGCKLMKMECHSGCSCNGNCGKA